MSKLLKIISLYCEDLLIIIGLIIVISTTYKINWLVANYMLGAIFIFMGLILSKRPPKN
ncbi:hypothetical protein TPELB_23600 [Terrisporobacter petrolearius]|uniref:DUF1056 family protein n=1 Tax=Terrisporobacter petrolearius TaxID=1460447 RepID=A0ABZ3FE14_9FIRM